MNKIKKIIMIVFALVLLLTAGFMFYVQNVYIPEIQQSQVATVFVATEEIKPNTRISDDLFQEKTIPASAVLDHYILNFSFASGAYTNSTIFEGDVLSNNRIVQESLETNRNLQISVVPNYFDDIQPNDLVNIYVVKPDNDNEFFNVETVFLARKVEKVQQEDVKTHSTRNFHFSIHVNEDELKRYYAAEHSGEIITTKIVNPNVIDIATGLTPFNPEEIIFKQGFGEDYNNQEESE